MKYHFSLCLLLVSVSLFSQISFQKVISSDAEVVQSISPCGDQGYLVSVSCESDHQSHLFKTDSVGNVVWSKSLNMDGSNFPLVAGECSTGYYVMGIYSGTDSGNYFCRLDLSGNLQSATLIPGSIDNNIRTYPAVYQLPGGDFMISTTGRYMGVARLDLSGNIIFHKTYFMSTWATYEGHFACATRSSDDAMILCSSFNEISIIKVDTLGNLVWTKNLGIANCGDQPAVTSVIQSSDSAYIIYGTINGEYPFLKKLDLIGDLIWQKDFMVNEELLYGGEINEAANGDLWTTGVDSYFHATLKIFDASGNYLSGGFFGTPSALDMTVENCAITHGTDNGFILASAPNEIFIQTSLPSEIALIKTSTATDLFCTYHPISMVAFTHNTDYEIPGIFNVNTLTAPAVPLITSIAADSRLTDDFCAVYSSTNDHSAIPENISAFPSPITSGENLQLNISGMNGASEISIYDASGKVVKQFNREFSSNQNSPMEISTSDMAAGIYLVRVTGPNQKILAVSKFIVR